MPEADRIPDALILAAAKRAQLHQDRDEGVAIWQIKAHLGLPHNGWTTRQVRPRLDAFVAAGLLEHAWVRSRNLWAVTSTGRRRAGAFSELPESPQHRRWREACALAGEHISKFRREAGKALAEATQLLEVGGDSTAWFALGTRLEKECLRLGSATFCLHEWVEPDDAKADLDPGHRLQDAAMRNMRALWT